MLSCSALIEQRRTQPGGPSTPTAGDIVTAGRESFRKREVAIDLERSTYTGAHVFNHALNNCLFSTIISDVM